MEYCIGKTGVEPFDTLHVMGFSVFLAEVTQASVEYVSESTLFLVRSHIELPACDLDSILRMVLTLPTLEDVMRLEPTMELVSMALTNLDGLLAATCTSPGARTVSTWDLRSQS